MADGHCCYKFVRALVIIFNALFALCGLALMGIGIWMLVDSKVDDILDLTSDASNAGLLRISAIVLIVFGAVLFIFSLLGIIGAIAESKVVLGIYLAVLIIAFCGGIASAILAIIFKDSLVDGLSDTLRRSLQNYFKNSTCDITETGEKWNAVQTTLDCCGVDTPGSGYETMAHCWSTSESSGGLPPSCYTQRNCTTACTVRAHGCVEKVEDEITYYAPILIGLAIGVAMFQTIGIIFAFCLCVNAPRSSSGYKRQSRTYDY